MSVGVGIRRKLGGRGVMRPHGAGSFRRGCGGRAGLLYRGTCPRGTVPHRAGGVYGAGPRALPPHPAPYGVPTGTPLCICALMLVAYGH